MGIMMSGRSPFDAEDVMQIYRNIVKGFKQDTYPEDFETDLKDVIGGLCRKKPEERIPMGPGGLNNIKKHPWFQAAPIDIIDKRTFRPPFEPAAVDLAKIAS